MLTDFHDDAAADMNAEVNIDNVRYTKITLDWILTHLPQDSELGVQLIIELTTDDYPRETFWTLKTIDEVVIDGISENDLSDRRSNYTFTLCLPTDIEYVFII